MDLLQLTYFRTLARWEHVTRAAMELRIAQPSLSKTIARLEAELGVPLFDRTGRNLRLNAYGRAFLARVDRALTEIEEGKRELRQMAKANEETVILTVSTTRLLPGLLRAFLREHPRVRIRQYTGSAEEMAMQIVRGEADFCIAGAEIKGDEIAWEPLMVEEVYLIVPPDHPLSGRGVVRLAELRDEPFICVNKGHEFRELTDGFCRRAGFEPKVHFSGDEADVIADLVRQGLGVAFVPALTWWEKEEHETRRLRIEAPRCERVIGLAWSRRHHLTRAAEAFREFARRYFAQLVGHEGVRGVEGWTPSPN
ncbi:LysR family transcriptional regulator [Alicyclobacillus acidocaldarius]|uniref:Transcriptional regulator, LysR n=1 Tax=Alicyclobacillus acidocaldarius (strain Tc-4-1) TaxID=1048834 RepID=F8IKA4_ALIAT|nr:LysR family transcriptional regulator [Alicyclobacillus acidocaldarius]AEJ42292.1 Transcriptional regulator, LysR [Alicyclobacillus acidocaldarius subsp. acidocaldarius Tc-4-1]